MAGKRKKSRSGEHRRLPAPPATPAPDAPESSTDLQAALHELRVYQEELRVQHEDLMDAQRLLEASRDRYIDLYDFAPIPYISLDRHGLIVEINLTGASLLGAERSRLLGTPMTVFVEKSHLPAFLDHMRRCREGAALVETEVVLAVRQSAPMPAQFSSRPAAAPEGRPAALFRTAVFDLTERKRAEAERQQLLAADAAGRAKDHFLAVLSHELRTPLNPILTAVSALDGKEDLPPALRPVIDMIRRNVLLEARLVDDLLDVTRITRGKLNLQSEVLDLHAALLEVVQMVAEDTRRGGLKVETRFHAAAHHVRGDPVRLRQIFWNLLRNAIKFTPRGGRITITTTHAPPPPPSPSSPVPTGGGIKIEVADNGHGIDSAALDRLFQPFEQVHPGLTAGGLGLGLAISRGLAEAHGGSIHATSAGPGKGAAFTVFLPAVPAPAESPAPPVPPAVKHNRHKRRHILLVEDHADTLNTLARVLRLDGHHVHTATTLGEARKLLHAHQFDLVLSDLALPDGSGHDLLTSLPPGRRPNAVALSGFGSDADRERSLASGFQRHLTKPIDYRDLDAVIQGTP